MKHLLMIASMIAVWIAGCFVADFIFKIESNCFAMLWGYAVANVVFWVGSKTYPGWWSP